MNSSSRLHKFWGAMTICLFCLCFLPAKAGWQPYDWLVTIETEAFSSQFKYASSVLYPLVEARISYARSDGSDQTNYETLWFCKGKAFGLERYLPFGIEPGNSVAVKVVHKTKVPTEYDYRAAANSILRILLDARAAQDSLQLVIVPDQSFSYINNELLREHYTSFNAPLETPYRISGVLFMQDESDLHTQTMCYAPNSLGY